MASQALKMSKNPKKRLSYTMEMKKRTADYAEIHGNRKAAREFGVNESMVRRWKRDKALIATLPPNKKAMRGSKRACWPEVEVQEEDINEVILSEKDTLPKKRLNRVSYTMEMKKQTAEYAEIHGNRKAAREFSVNESMVRRWKRDKALIATLPPHKKAMRGHQARWPELEKGLKEFILSKATSGSAVSIQMIGQKAKEMAKDSSIVGFNGGPTWCRRFMRRNRMSVDSEGGLHLHPLPIKFAVRKKSGKRVKSPKCEVSP